MKDPRGHGSNSRGGSLLTRSGRGIIPSRPFREGTAHQVALADQHGVRTDHLHEKRVADIRERVLRYGWGR